MNGLIFRRPHLIAIRNRTRQTKPCTILEFYCNTMYMARGTTETFHPGGMLLASQASNNRADGRRRPVAPQKRQQNILALHDATSKHYKHQEKKRSSMQHCNNVLMVTYFTAYPAGADGVDGDVRPDRAKRGLGRSNCQLFQTIRLK